MIIAITTFFQSQDNYGQLLQAYALQQTIMKIGHYPYIIRYGFHEYLKPVHTPFIQIPSVPPPPPSFWEHIHWPWKHRTYVTPGSKSNRHFDDFRSQHLNLSQYVYNTVEDLRKYPPVADCYLTGSDQVWAQLLSKENNKTFFLDFGPKELKRIAYAPSFAINEYPTELCDILAHELAKFDALSVRELSGVEICHKVGYEAKLVLDPTLLLAAHAYIKLSQESQPISSKKYCFVYHVNVSSPEELYWEKFHQYNKGKGLKAYAVHANQSQNENIEFLDNAEYIYPNIQEWIAWIRNAQYVLTSSFHGMIFSILLHKPFAICLRTKSMFAGNDRVTTLLSSLGLENRIVTRESPVNDIIQQRTNWKAVDRRLQALRLESIDFLKKALQF